MLQDRAQVCVGRGRRELDARELHGSAVRPVANRVCGDAVFRQLVDELARNDEIEERVEVTRKRRERIVPPCGAGVNGYGVDARQQRAAAVGHVCGCGRRRLPCDLLVMKRDDPDHVHVDTLPDPCSADVNYAGTTSVETRCSSAWRSSTYRCASPSAVKNRKNAAMQMVAIPITP